jgi:hypothetical protein
MGYDLSVPSIALDVQPTVARFREMCNHRLQMSAKGKAARSPRPVTGNL